MTDLICHNEQTDYSLEGSKNIFQNGTKKNNMFVQINEAGDIVTYVEKAHEHNTKGNIEKIKFHVHDEDDNIYSDILEEQNIPTIPDGGWGWVVVFASFLISACADGLAFSFGLLHEEFTDYFQTTQSKTSLIGSFFIATPLLSGPIMSALVDRYGCRAMTVIAGVLSTGGFVLAAFSNSVEMLCLTLGFMSGLAIGILYVTAVVSVAFWFDKKRNLAVSLSSCGIGVGTLIFSPLTHYLLEVYDWRNTLVLLAGTLLNMCVCGTLMRMPEWLEIKQIRDRRLSKARSKKSTNVQSLSSGSIVIESDLLSPEEFKTLLKSGNTPEYILTTLATSIAAAERLDTTTQMNANKNNKRINSVIHLPTFVQDNENVPIEVVEKLMENKRLYTVLLQNYPCLKLRSRSEVNIPPELQSFNGLKELSKLPVAVQVRKPKTLSKSDSKYKTDSKSILHSKQEYVKSKSISENNIETHSNCINKDKIKSNNVSLSKEINGAHNPMGQGWVSRQLSTNRQYLKDMHLYRNTIMYRGAMMNIPRYRLKASSLPNIYNNSLWSLETESDDETLCHQWTWIMMKKTFHFKLFTEFHFLMFNLSSLILSIWFIVPYFFLNSYMNGNNMSGAATMISIIGVSSGIGIVILGWAGDRSWVNVIKTYAVCLIVCGVSVAAFPVFITNYWGLASVSLVFGLTFASSYSFIPAILMELMPIDYFTVSYGLILLSQGIGHLFGPPLGGLLYDLTGTWDLAFYVGGAFIVVSGICMFVIAYTKNFRLWGTAPLLKESEKQKSHV